MCMIRLCLWSEHHSLAVAQMVTRSVAAASATIGDASLSGFHCLSIALISIGLTLLGGSTGLPWQQSVWCYTPAVTGKSSGKASASDEQHQPQR
jgi:hypothetical protein